MAKSFTFTSPEHNQIASAAAREGKSVRRFLRDTVSDYDAIVARAENPACEFGRCGL